MSWLLATTPPAMASLATRPAAPGDPSADAANPYAGNKHLTEDQQTLLAEYARLAVTIQSVRAVPACLRLRLRLRPRLRLRLSRRLSLAHTRPLADC